MKKYGRVGFGGCHYASQKEESLKLVGVSGLFVELLARLELATSSLSRICRLALKLPSFSSTLSSGPIEPMAPYSDAIRPATTAMPHLPFRALRARLPKSAAYFIISRIIKTISKGVVFIISPLLNRLFRRSSYLRYNQYKHCGFVSIYLQLDWLGVTQTTVACLNW